MANRVVVQSVVLVPRRGSEQGFTKIMLRALAF